jgi:hypothetical protein
MSWLSQKAWGSENVHLLATVPSQQKILDATQQQFDFTIEEGGDAKDDRIHTKGSG